MEDGVADGGGDGDDGRLAGAGGVVVRAVQEVDVQLRELQRAFPTRPLSDLAILAALNLAYECLESKEEYQQLHGEIEKRSRHLIQILEASDTSFLPGP